MEATQNTGDQAHSELSSMAPMMAMMAEMQRELGELRRRNRNYNSDSDSSEDGSAITPLAEPERVFTSSELTAHTYNGLFPTVCHDPRFRRVLDYRYYRLHKRSDRYDANDARRVSKWTRQLEASLKLRFDGTDPLSILQFLSSFVEAANTNGIREGAALHVLGSFLSSPAKAEFTAFHSTAYPVAVDWLLMTYAPVSAVASEYKAISSMGQGRRESPREFSLRLRQRASRLGPLMDEAAVTILMEGLDPSISGFVQSALKHQKPTFTNVLQEAELVYSSVSASEQKTEVRSNEYGVKHSRPAVLTNPARGLPPYPRGSVRERVPVLAVEALRSVDPSLQYSRDYEEHNGQETNEWEQGPYAEEFEEILIAHVAPPQRVRYCYTCWRPGHFSAECPLIPEEERAAIALRRAAVLKQRPSYARPSPRYPTPHAHRPGTKPEESPFTQDLVQPFRSSATGTSNTSASEKVPLAVEPTHPREGF